MDVITRMEKKAIHARIDLEENDPLTAKAHKIKAELGVKAWAEMLRVLVMRHKLKKGGD